jgi:hypothetical protein
MKFSPENLIKIALAILLVVCIFHLPYGYYQLLRYLAVVGFAFLAYYEYYRKSTPMVILYVALAVLFQPLYKFSLGRDVWVVVDVAVAAGLILLFFMPGKKNDREEK